MGFISLLRFLCDDAECMTHAPSAPGKLLTLTTATLPTAGAQFVGREILDQIREPSSSRRIGLGNATRGVDLGATE